jgi:hypothetical protein
MFDLYLTNKGINCERFKFDEPEKYHQMDEYFDNLGKSNFEKIAKFYVEQSKIKFPL